MYIKNWIKFILRTCIYGIIIYIFFFDKPLMSYFTDFKPTDKLSVVHFIWAFMMAELIIQLFPRKRHLVAAEKQQGIYYAKIDEGYDKQALKEYMKKVNIRAAVTMALWLLLIGLIGILYSKKWINESKVILASFSFYFFDYICILIWCPFQQFLMKSRCCTNCRIFNWGYFWVVSPLIFIRSFFTWSLFFAGLAVILFWEYNALRHPERFWNGSNQALRCSACEDKLCRIKKPLHKYVK